LFRFCFWSLCRARRLPPARHKYAKALWAMGEPSLFDKGSPYPREAYRLLFWPAIAQPGPVAIRIEPEQAGARLHWTHLEKAPTSEFERPEDAPNTPEPPIPTQCKVVTLSPAQWDAIRSCIDQSWFWSTPPGEPSLGVMDATVWVMEGVKNGRYHFVARELPDKNTAQRGLRSLLECGQMLQGLASS